jgi:glycosyltransferase involved in cell wall biosynthesis
LFSVKDQTFDNFECIVVDDGSKDGAELERVVHELADTRFTYLRKENGGACSARNVGVDAASGRYVAFLDSDDVFLPGKLKMQHDVLSGASADNLVVFGRLIVERSQSKRWLKPPKGPRSGERIDEYVMCTQGWIQSSTIVLPIELARMVRWDEALPSSQDTDYAVRLASAGATFAFIEEPLIILDDVFDPNRVSKQGNYKPLLAWIERMRGVHVSEKAYWAYRGWQCARVASYSDRWKGIRLYAASVRRGVYRPLQAIRIGAQVCLPRHVYQSLIDRVVSAFGARR